MQAHRIYAALSALTATAVLAFAAPASASYYVPRARHACKAGYVHKTARVRRHHRWVKQARCYFIAPKAHSAAPDTPIVGVGNVPGCLDGADPTAYLQEYNATVLRVIVTPAHGADGSALPCIQAAIAAGYRVHLAIAYSNRLSPAEDASFFEQVLPQYAPYLWAVSIGNEQEGPWNGGNGETGAQYAAVWRAVEPVVARLTPNALRIAGEISPWGASFIQAAVAHGLPGAQVIAAHSYNTTGCFDIPSFTAWVHSLGLPVWFTEGLAGPGSWGYPDPSANRSLAQMAGAQIADAWLG